MSDLKEQLIKLGASTPELRADIKPVLEHLTQAGRVAAAAPYAGKIVNRALRAERVSSRKKYMHEAIVYDSVESWERNSRSMNGKTDILDLDEALMSADPGNVVDVYVYFMEYDEWDDEYVRGDLFQTVTVEIPASARGKIQKDGPRDVWLAV